mmetsp:Transcript_179933/g.437781  ORF Transcript_179933/g.437781 Transcript_179933/m.437781 type:complete len:366 (+) Transcript_179933:38-1135(+)
MAAMSEVRLVVKHTFLEFVEESAPHGGPSRQRAFTDSALASDGGRRRRHLLSGDADSSASPQELPSHLQRCEANASSSSAPSSGCFPGNPDAAEELRALLGMPHGGIVAPSLAPESECRPAGSSSPPAARLPPEGGAGARSAVVGVPEPALPPRGLPRRVPMHVRPMASGACGGAMGSSQARPAQRDGLRANVPAGPRRQLQAEGKSDVVAGIPEDQLTTVLFRNLPVSFTRTMFLDLVDTEGFAGAYNFVYVPVDFASQAGLGYSVINFTSPAMAQLFWNRFDGFSNWSVLDSKVGALNWSSPHQGLTSHVERYRNSPVMHSAVPDEWKPAVFVNGVRVAFPAPTKALKAPKIRHAVGGVLTGS